MVLDVPSKAKRHHISVVDIGNPDEVIHANAIEFQVREITTPSQDKARMGLHRRALGTRRLALL